MVAPTVREVQAQYHAQCRIGNGGLITQIALVPGRTRVSTTRIVGDAAYLAQHGKRVVLELVYLVRTTAVAADLHLNSCVLGHNRDVVLGGATMWSKVIGVSRVSLDARTC